MPGTHHSAPDKPALRPLRGAIALCHGFCTPRQARGPAKTARFFGRIFKVDKLALVFFMHQMRPKKRATAGKAGRSATKGTILNYKF